MHLSGYRVWPIALLITIALAGYALQAQAAEWPRERAPVPVPGWLQSATVPVRLAAGLPSWLVILIIAVSLSSPARPAAIVSLLLRGLSLEAAVLVIKVVTTLPFVWPLAGAAESHFLAAEPDIGAGFWEAPPAGAPVLTLPIAFRSAGTFDVWLRLRAPDDAANSVHVGLDGEVQGDPVTVRGDGWWRWTNATTSGDSARLHVDTSGSHVLSIWPREDGVQLDQVVIATGFVPGSGPVDPTFDAPGVVNALEAESAAKSTPGVTHVWRLKTDDGTLPLRHMATAIRQADYPSAHTARAVFLAGAAIAATAGASCRRRAVLGVTVVAIVGLASWASAAHSLAGIGAGVGVGVAMWHLAAPFGQSRHS